MDISSELSTRSPLIIEVQVVNGVHVAIVDTGATCTIVSRKLANSWVRMGYAKYNHTTMKFVLADRTTVDAASQIEVEVKLLDNAIFEPVIRSTTKVSMFVLPTANFDILLGRDLIAYFGLFPNYGIPGIHLSNTQVAPEMEYNEKAKEWIKISAKHKQELRRKLPIKIVGRTGGEIAKCSYTASTIFYKEFQYQPEHHGSYMLARKYFLKCCKKLSVYPLTDGYASYWNSQCKFYISLHYEKQATHINFLTTTKAMHLGKAVWLNPIWDDIYRIILWLEKDPETPFSCLLFMPKWCQHDWWHMLCFLSDNRKIELQAQHDMFICPVGTTMPKVAYNFSCFHIDNHSITKALGLRNGRSLLEEESSNLVELHQPYCKWQPKRETTKFKLEKAYENLQNGIVRLQLRHIGDENMNVKKGKLDTGVNLHLSKIIVSIMYDKLQRSHKHIDPSAPITISYKNNVTLKPGHIIADITLYHSRHKHQKIGKLFELEGDIIEDVLPINTISHISDSDETDNDSVSSLTQDWISDSSEDSTKTKWYKHRVTLQRTDETSKKKYAKETHPNAAIFFVMQNMNASNGKFSKIAMETPFGGPTINTFERLLQSKEKMINLIKSERENCVRDLTKHRKPEMKHIKQWYDKIAGRIMTIEELDLDTIPIDLYSDFEVHNRQEALLMLQEISDVDLIQTQSRLVDGKLEMVFQVARENTCNTEDNEKYSGGQMQRDDNTRSKAYIHEGKYAKEVNDLLAKFSRIQDSVKFDPEVSRASGHSHEVFWKGEVKPYRAKPYRLSPVEMEVLKNMLQKYIDMNWIKESNSPWAAPIFLVPKKTINPETKLPEYRLVIDYRKMNEQSIKIGYPLPKIDELLSSIKSSKFFTTLDLQSGYHHIPLTENASKASGFISPIGHYEFNVLPFGIHSAPPTFQRIMDKLLEKPIKDGYCRVYLDDVIIFSNTLEEHMEHLTSIFSILDENNMRIRADKCEWLQKEVKYLGHIVSGDGIKTDPKKVQAIQEFVRPRNLKNLQSFLGVCIQYSQYIHHYAEMSYPLTNLLSYDHKTLGKNPKIRTKQELEEEKLDEKKTLVWTPECQFAFERIKKAMSDTADPHCILAFPDPTLPYELHTDASDRALGAVLSQNGRPIAYYSKKLLPAESRYMTYEREALAVVKSVKKWHHLIHNNLPITIHCDNKGVTCLLKQNFTNARQARWSCFLQQYNIQFQFIPGKENKVADGISRQYDGLNHVTTQGELNLVSRYFPKEFEDELYDYLMQVVKVEEDVKKVWHNVKSTAWDLMKTKEDKPINTQELAQPSIMPIVDQTTGKILPNLLHEDVLQEWKNSYKLDPIFGPFYRHEKEQMVILGMSPKDFELKKDLLYWKGRIVVPAAMRQHMLSLAHDEVQHLGRHQMQARLTVFWWPRMWQDINAYSKYCLNCLRSKKKSHIHKGYKPQPIPPADRPFQRLHIDFIGRFPAVHMNNQLVNRAMTVIDAFSKMAFVIPCHDTYTQSDMIRALLTYVIPYTGVPETIVTDRGIEFKYNFSKEMFKTLGITHRMTSAYHPQANAAIERWHSDINSYFKLVALNYSDDVNWTHALGLATYVHNQAKHASLGYSPTEVVMGFKDETPVQNYLKRLESEQEDQIFDDKIKERVQVFEKAREIAYETLKKMEDRYYEVLKKKYKYQENEHIEEGDYVLVDTSRFDGKSKKLRKFQPHYLGPFEVTKVHKGGASVEINPLGSNIDGHVNKQHLVLWDDQFVQTTPIAVVPSLLPKGVHKVQYVKKDFTLFNEHMDEFPIKGENVKTIVGINAVKITTERHKGQDETKVTYLTENERLSTQQFKEFVIKKGHKYYVHSKLVRHLLNNPLEKVWTDREARHTHTEALRTKLFKKMAEIRTQREKALSSGTSPHVLKQSEYLHTPKTWQKHSNDSESSEEDEFELLWPCGTPTDMSEKSFWKDVGKIIDISDTLVKLKDQEGETVQTPMKNLISKEGYVHYKLQQYVVNQPTEARSKLVNLIEEMLKKHKHHTAFLTYLVN